MEPMHSPARDDMAPDWDSAPAALCDSMPHGPLPHIPPAFAPGALDLLRERVARMREAMQASPVPQDNRKGFLPPVASEEGAARQEAAQGPNGLSGELTAIREALGRLGGEDRSVLLAGAVAALGRKIDLLNAKSLDPVALRRLELQAGELRAAVDRALRLRDASDERARAQAFQQAEVQEQVALELDELRSRLHRLSEQIGTLPEEFASALAEQVDLLLDRIEGPGMEASALAPLVDVIERHLVALTERVVASQQRLERLDGIEQALHRISDQMEDLQNTSADVSAEAVQAVALRLSARDDAPAVVGLKRGLAALEARQREFELRTEEFLVREVELELKGLADLERPHPPRPHEREVYLSVADMTPPSIDLDRRIFDAALGDSHVVSERTLRTDWLAAAERAQVLEETRPRKKLGKNHFALAGRAAVLVTAVGLAGVTVLQVARPATSYARSGAAGVAAVAKSPAAAPVQAPDVASLPLPSETGPLRTAALAGDPDAAYEIGVRFADGRGMEANQTAAIKWLAFAASKGSVPAAYRLGAIHEYADRNSMEARRLYAWAAERGNLRAMHNLGVMATEGVDGRPDWAAAIKWFRQAAGLGLRDSQHNLGVIYARGLSGQTDYAEAFKWFAIAAAQGDTDSARKRDEVVRRSDEPTITRARAMAAAFVPGQPDKAANAVQLRPEWTAPVPVASTPTVAPSAAPVEAAAAPRTSSGT